MAISIVKLSKSFFVKLLVGIIILPFIFWGMGDVFRGGNQNIVANIDSEKVNTQEFINYLNRLDLSENERKNIKKSDLLEKILSDYIGKKIIDLEVKEIGINLSDSSLRNIIINDKLFFKNKKFSRTKYEKFLLQSSLSAPSFERNMLKQEEKRQLLSFLSAGLIFPDFLVEQEYIKENQIRSIEYIDLKNFYSKKPNEKEIKKIYDENKDLFKESYKSVSYAELTPQVLIGKKDFNEEYFKKIDKIENSIFDGVSFKEIIKDNSLFNFKKFDDFNLKKIDALISEDEKIKKNLLKKAFLIKEINTPELIKINENYFIVNITSETQKNIPIENKEVQDLIINQIIIKKKINENTKIAKDIGEKKFDLKEMKNFANKNDLVIKSTEINGIKDNNIFSAGLIKRIFESLNNEILLITDSRLTDNFIIYNKGIEYKKFNRKSEDHKKYKSIAKLNFAKNIYNIYDESLNKKYNVTINNKTIERIKNSF